jgi:ribonuclease G
VTFQGRREEVEERAVPFRVGEEVLVEIVEPHMFEADDAVAKIDGYIISVRGGGPLVGQKLMVRIEEVGRTAAVAVPIDAPVRSADDDEDGVDSRTRRRGRRGGRRRSAESEPAAG